MHKQEMLQIHQANYFSHKTNVKETNINKREC